MGSSMSSQVVLVSSGNASNNQVACANCFKYGSQCYLKTTASRKTSPPARSVGKATLPPRPSTICQVCWEGPFAAHLGLFAKRASTPWFTSSKRCTEGYSYSSSWAGLESRAGAGCTWCGFLFAMRTGSDMTSAKSDGPLKITVGETVDWHFPLRGVTPEATRQLHVQINGDRAFEGIVYASADDPAAPYITARSRILDVGSPHALALAKSCLENCRRGHKNCNITNTPNPILPTRVIDCTDPDHPHLVHTGNVQGIYLALSYVWGEPQPYRTVLSNISAYEARMDPSLLSPTIRDAIRVTHALGYQYLWVDALCIIQDSDEDKQHELSRMHLLYRDAHFTIVAASAQKVSEGFL